MQGLMPHVMETLWRKKTNAGINSKEVYSCTINSFRIDNIDLLTILNNLLKPFIFLLWVIFKLKNPERSTMRSL